MKKSLIVKQAFDGYEVGAVYKTDEASVIDSWNHWLRVDFLETVDVIEEVDLEIERSNRMIQIRIVRDQKLIENDKKWLIAAKKKEDTTNLEVEAQLLRDMPELAAAELAELETVEEIKAFNPFEV